ncbi:MAG: hopanoid-associated sugar epimerase [Cyanobacteria bacterium P01_H01_bin.15]
MGIKAFVTGGTGFVGAQLVRSLLAQNFEVRALVRETSDLQNLAGLRVETVFGDLRDPEIAGQLQGCQVLFHCAAHYSLWRRDRKAVYESNVLGTQNLLGAAQKAGIERTVHTSSVAAIGTPNTGAAVTETYQSPPEKLISAYKQSKYYAEQVAWSAIQQGQDIIIVNPTTPIGPRDVKPTPTGDIILRFLRRQMPAYVDTGLNFIDVRDVATGHLLALERGRTGERYILGNQNLTLQQFLAMLADLTGLSAPTWQVPLWLPLTVAWLEEWVLASLGKSPSVPFDGVRMSSQKMFYDPRKAIQELGLPQSPIKQAAQDAIAWFQASQMD